MNTSIRTIAASFALLLASFCGGTAHAASPSQVGPTIELDAQANTEVNTEDSSEDSFDPSRFDAAVTLEGQVNINTASAAELELLPGIGPSIAKRIVGYREQHTFKQRNNIMRVKGIGQKTFAKIKDFLTVEGQTTLRIAK